MIPQRIVSGAVAVAAAAALLAPVAATAAKRPEQPRGPAAQYLVSLGDSYATGYQPAAGGGVGRGTRAGFVYQTPQLAAKRGWRLRVVQFGCGGATTTSILKARGCPAHALGPGGRAYDGTTQIAAAEAFLKRNRAKTGLITVSIGGNDVTACVRDPVPVICVANASGVVRANVKALVKRLRRAAGPDVRIVGTTYPDVILGAYLGGTQADRDLATLSVTAFRSVINVTLKEEYEAVGGRFADVTAASGAYTPLTETVDVPELGGGVPVAVARVCELTWFCRYQDIHAKRSGYRIIAELVARTLPKNAQFAPAG